MNATELGKCYACGKPAVSREHVPPLCLFPEEKDVGRSVRENLITVPACDEHNLRKSKDDEYLMMTIAGSFSNNELAADQTRTKISRAWTRRPHLAQMAVRQPSTVLLNGKPSIAYRIEPKRFDRAMRLIAAGLIFHHYDLRWPGGFLVWGTSMLPSKPTSESFATQRAILAALPIIFAHSPWHGANPEAFKYQLFLASDQRTSFVRLVFYEGFEVCVMGGSPSLGPADEGI